MKKPKKKRLCVVCSARVVNMNPKTTTCSTVCTKAKHADRTRAEQLAFEMEQDGWPEENRGYEE